MILRLISVGKIREPFYRSGVGEYLRRIRPYCPIELVEGMDEKLSPRAGDREVTAALNREGQRVLGMLKESELLVALDARGCVLDSEGLASWLERVLQSGRPRISFLVGGAAGLGEEVRRRADCIFSLSVLTLPHQLAVLVLAEQLYRAFKIIRGEPYHR
ncbi:MAG: 23S rRNA (pseudouridine(1915)-N(3))-methyltransferase RlmH [Syntrophomonadaceae bacterium]|nr:23S rRNA (pseudouridine(1915)-N(3))-methyltransferase RlmH [Syntrophomonadaceae bacterium]